MFLFLIIVVILVLFLVSNKNNSVANSENDYLNNDQSARSIFDDLKSTSTDHIQYDNLPDYREEPLESSLYMQIAEDVIQRASNIMKHRIDNRNYSSFGYYVNILFKIMVEKDFSCNEKIRKILIDREDLKTGADSEKYGYDSPLGREWELDYTIYTKYYDDIRLIIKSILSVATREKIDKYIRVRGRDGKIFTEKCGDQWVKEAKEEFIKRTREYPNNSSVVFYNNLFFDIPCDKKGRI